MKFIKYSSKEEIEIPLIDINKIIPQRDLFKNEYMLIRLKDKSTYIYVAVKKENKFIEEEK
jgi:hypothetical protein